LIENFNGRLREECLNQSNCHNFQDARQTIEKWWQDYNHARLCRALNYLTLVDFRERHLPSQAGLLSNRRYTNWGEVRPVLVI
jgi:transposase InsO family protein